ncbi:MAG: hypothetical protein LBS88_02025 [Tannerellaceae bacterium]|jgi:Tol biopolymer transport system component|nr:hypothetical protein [Tannerellaceae bacterium]
MRNYFCLLILLTLTGSCSIPVAREQTDAFPPVFPDYISAWIPCNIAPLNFEVGGASFIRADISVNEELLASLKGKRLIRIPEKKWKEWLAIHKGKEMTVEVSVWSDQYREGIRYAPFTLTISPYEIDNWLAYRLIEPGYEYWNRMGIYQRDLTSFTEKAIVTNEQNHRGCLNCHAFHKFSPDNMMFHARGEKGTTVLVTEGTPRRLDFDKLTSELRATYPAWHPSGDYIAFSSNRTYQSFYHSGKMPVEVYDVASDLFVYDLKHDQILTDKRFINPEAMETFPSFSPDGSTLFFCTAEPMAMPMENRRLKYALCRVPFDASTGRLGEVVDTLYNPQVEGGSASFPRISPDGNYLLFTEAASATFPVWHKEADLKMIRISDNKRIDTKTLNSEEAESYHSWSSNGRWIVFGSRRIDGRYTRLYIAGIDEDGRAQKPFLLPQKDPRNNTTRLKSYNIPEFICEEVRLGKKEIRDLFK